jgi:hypothetical protein
MDGRGRRCRRAGAGARGSAHPVGARWRGHLVVAALRRAPCAVARHPVLLVDPRRVRAVRGSAVRSAPGSRRYRARPQSGMSGPDLPAPRGGGSGRRAGDGRRPYNRPIAQPLRRASSRHGRGSRCHRARTRSRVVGPVRGPIERTGARAAPTREDEDAPGGDNRHGGGRARSPMLTCTTASGPSR